MTDLAQRAERVLDSLTCDRCPACDNKHGTTPDQQWYCEGCGERWETSNEAADLIRELVARVAELEARCLRLNEQLRLANMDACIAETEANEYRDAGPTPLRGRVTRRDE